MFDGELPAAQCELLSRRLGRDEILRARWARYALIGAALRSEPVSRVTLDFSHRVGAAIDAGDGKAAGTAARTERNRWFRTLASGTALAAGIAAAAVLVLRNQAALQDDTLATVTTTAQHVPARSGAAGGLTYLMPAETLAIAGVAGSRVAHVPRDYVVPVTSGNSAAVPASLASYVTAHSEYSSPLVRRGLISRLVSSSEPALAVAPNDASGDEVVIAGHDDR
jgi:hypothetical protein